MHLPSPRNGSAQPHNLSGTIILRPVHCGTAVVRVKTSSAFRTRGHSHDDADLNWFSCFLLSLIVLNNCMGRHILMLYQCRGRSRMIVISWGCVLQVVVTVYSWYYVYGRTNSIVGRYCILVLLDSDSDASAVLRLPVYSPVIGHNFFY